MRNPSDPNIFHIRNAIFRDYIIQKGPFQKRCEADSVRIEGIVSTVTEKHKNGAQNNFYLAVFEKYL